MIPFLALPVAVALRIAPVATGLLAAASIALMAAMTATDPVNAWDGQVLRRLTSADGSSPTVSDFLGVTGWYAVVPFYLFVLGAVACALRATPWSVTRSDVLAGVAAVAGWALVALAAPPLLTAAVP
jgi:hypothetical protein